VLTPLVLMMTPLIVADTQWYEVDGQLPGIYFALAIAWRTATQAEVRRRIGPTLRQIVVRGEVC
jgi:hypothetical protein